MPDGPDAAATRLHGRPRRLLRDGAVQRCDAEQRGVPTEATGQQAISLRHGQHELDAGTYRLDRTSLAAGADPYPKFEVAVPDGWVAVDGWALNRPAAGQDAPAVAVTFGM